jgi:hypothetical protein
MAGKAQKSLGGKSELNSVFGLEKVHPWNSIRTSTKKREIRGKKFRRDQWSAARFRKVGGVL